MLLNDNATYIFIFQLYFSTLSDGSVKRFCVSLDERSHQKYNNKDNNALFQ